jgi:hypothetical protein
LADARGVALAVAVEHTDRDDRRAVGEAGEPARVVRRLGDGAGDVRPVAVLVVGVRVAVDEVVAGDEARLLEVRRAAEGPPVRVGHAAVENRDGDAAPARAPGVDQVLPGLRRVDAVARPEVPLDRLPAGADAGVVRHERRGARHGVRRRVRDAIPALEAPDRPGDVVDALQHPRRLALALDHDLAGHDLGRLHRGGQGEGGGERGEEAAEGRHGGGVLNDHCRPKLWPA